MLPYSMLHVQSGTLLRIASQSVRIGCLGGAIGLSHDCLTEHTGSGELAQRCGNGGSVQRIQGCGISVLITRCIATDIWPWSRMHRVSNKAEHRRSYEPIPRKLITSTDSNLIVSTSMRVFVTVCGV